jgi:hypothetical protein
VEPEQHRTRTPFRSAEPKAARWASSGYSGAHSGGEALAAEHESPRKPFRSVPRLVGVG